MFVLLQQVSGSVTEKYFLLIKCCLGVVHIVKEMKEEKTATKHLKLHTEEEFVAEGKKSVTGWSNSSQ